MAIFKETKIKSSILVTLTLLFVLIGVVPLLFSNWKLITINREELESTLRETFVTTAATVSSQVAEYVDGYRSQVREFAPKAVGSIQNPNSSQSKKDLSLIMRDPNILKMRILDTQGKGPYAQKMNFQDPRVRELELEGFHEALQGKSYIGSPYYKEVNQYPILLIAEPLHNEDADTVGVVSIILSLEPLLRMLTDQSPGGTRVYVVDAQGNLLLHPDKSQMQTHANLAQSAVVADYLRSGGRVSSVRPFEEKEKGGKSIPILGSHSSIPDLNWGVIIQIEREIAFATVTAMIRESRIWAICIALISAVVGILLARRITTPVKVLAKHAMDIGRHQNFDQKIDIKAGNEIQQLADTFNYMTEEIRQNIIGLQTAARENKELFISSIRMLAAAIDAKDPYTRGHSERVKDYALVIAKQMGFTFEQLERVEIAALLHDVGKIGIEDRILRKPTNLTPEEFEIMKTHPDKGANILSQIAQLSDIIPGMRAHHENYDGSGYPQGLKGEQIPLLARIITIADTFDAMTTDRPYQKAFTLEFALNRIRTMQAIKYDPVIVEAFSRACEEGRVSLRKPSRPRPKQPVA